MSIICSYGTDFYSASTGINPPHMVYYEQGEFHSLILFNVLIESWGSNCVWPHRLYLMPASSSYCIQIFDPRTSLLTPCISMFPQPYELTHPRIDWTGEVWGVSTRSPSSSSTPPTDWKCNWMIMQWITQIHNFPLRCIMIVHYTCGFWLRAFDDSW